jgi:serine/threonine-protein kinase
MAEVYLVRDLRYDRPVALKVLRPELSAGVDAQRFTREVRLAASLQHPHILPVHDSGEAGGFLWYTMPFVEGESLRALLARQPQLPLTDALRIAIEVADALGYAHHHGIVHRDVKPENVLLSGGQAIVADFGLARVIDAAMSEKVTETGITLGTPAYMSPEQSLGDVHVDGRSDVYSLGCVLFEMLAGEPPFVGRTPQAILARRLSDPAPHLRALRDIPESVEEAVLVALARAPADRYPGATQFADALRHCAAEAEIQTHGHPRTLPPQRTTWLPGFRRRGTLLAGAVLAVLAALILVPRWMSPPSAPTLDPHRVAVAPFDTYDAGLTLWREGLMDVVSANVDGAGALRSVSPSTVLRRWQGRSDAESAGALGRAVGAGVAVVGRLLSAGPDSVRAVVLVLDVPQHSTVGELEVRESRSRLDRLGDSLSIGILGLLGESVGLGRERVSSLGASSLSALKAFLQGEQYLRRARWDSAATWYGNATEIDPTFALAHARLKIAMAWEVQALDDTLGDGHAFYAGQHNVGLPPRDSLLIVADSLQASLGADDSLTWQRTRRLLATLDEAARRYPSDPFVWYRIGEARYHFAPPLDYTVEDVMAGFDRAIALDSAFGPAYAIHSVELALILGGAPMARRYTQAYLRNAPPGGPDSAMAITDLLLGRTNQGLPEAVGRASPDVLYRVGLTLDMWFDSAETALALARVMAAKPAETFSAHELRIRYARILSVRGHLQAAGRELLAASDLTTAPDGEMVELFTELALVNAIPADRARSTFHRWLRMTPRGAVFALPWYAAARDTAALTAAGRLADSLAAAGDTPQHRQVARYGAAAARAYHDLARGDSVRALSGFLALPDSLCPDCYFDWLTRAELLMATGRLDQARRFLVRVLTYAWTVPTYPAALVLLGQLDEQRRDRPEAARAYRTALDAWRDPDLSLLPARRKAEDGWRRLNAAP